MKDSLKFALFAFLILVLLVGLGVGETEAQSPIDITPKELVILGITETQPFQHPFTVWAVNENITELIFSPGNLMEITRGKSFIAGTNVQVNPAVTRINKGLSQDFVVTVQNIPESGQYDGSITVSYKDQPVDAQDTLPISVRAAKFNVTPPQILLKFDKSFLGFGGTKSRTLALNEFSGQAPQEMIATLAKSTSVRLDPLIHGEDKSEVISKDKILKSVVIDNTSGGQGLAIKATFANPQVAAGTYSGTLTVLSTDLGRLTSVPVEVQVRYPWWLALLLIFAGILVSLMVSWWNTTGKKKNAIHGDVLKLREKLSSSDITRTCREEIEDMLNKVHELLDDDKWDDAQNKSKDAKTSLETCVDKKKGLRKKAEEVGGMIDLENDVRGKVMKLVNNNTGADVLNVYLPSLEGDLKTLKKEIDDEHYDSGDDDTLKEKITDLEKKLNAFTDPAPDGLLNGLANLEEDMRSFPQAYHDLLERGFIQPIRKDLSDVRRDINIEGLSGKIKSAHTQFKIVDELLNWDRLIDEYQQKGYVMSNAKNELQNCKDYLKSGIYLTEKSVDDIKKAIEKDKLEAKGKLPPSYRQKFEAAFSDPDRQTRSIKMASILSEALGTEDLPGKDKLSLMTLLRDIETSVEITPSEVETAQVPAFEAREVPSSSLLQRLQSLLDSFRQWWTPERKESTINIVLHVIVISILAVLGFSQLYANNPTFGARNVWEEYLALFLWGFGIQTGTATVTGVLKTFRGT
jgi:hypothetical protein